jgi:hypothetical protein
MPSTLFRRHYTGRAAQTGETSQQARAALLRFDPGTPPIPDAATVDQAFLESLFLEKLGRCRHHQWWTPSVPFMVKSVTPLIDEIVVRIPPVFLPDVICDVMPHWAAEDDGEEDIEVYGIAGLRARHERGRIVIARLGIPGRIVIPVRPNVWRKACLVAAEVHDPDHVRMPWLTAPVDLHPAETHFTERWPARYSPAGPAYRNSQYASQLLRRLPGLCPPPRAGFHDLWFNRVGDTCSIQFEWANGPSHAAVLKQLLDPLFDPGAEIDERDCEVIGRAEGYVTVRSRTQPTADVTFRRKITAHPRADDARRARSDAKMHAHRAAIERKHGYRVPRHPEPISYRPW